jgi:Uma2 family endonuclease
MILKTPPLADVETLGELLARLGNIPAERVRYWPFPGTATEADLLALDRPCELVDGTLVEKPVGFFESRLAIIIGHLIELFLDEHDLGFTTGEQAPYRILPRIVRMPDVAFVSWEQLPNRQLRQRGIAQLFPDLAVEVLSRGNTRAEMLRKREEYFRAGTKLVWEIHPLRQTAAVYTAPRRFTRVAAGGILDGADVLPGFQLSLRELFVRVRVSAPRGRS